MTMYSKLIAALVTGFVGVVAAEVGMPADVESWVTDALLAGLIALGVYAAPANK